jgi:carboxypeptidase C (cathepsin A)
MKHLLLLLFLISVLYCKSRIERSGLTTIPYYTGPPQTKSYTGYLEVRPEVNGHLWFWFFEHSTNPDTAPLAIWLNGGMLEYTVS